MCSDSIPLRCAASTRARKFCLYSQSAMTAHWVGLLFPNHHVFVADIHNGLKAMVSPNKLPTKIHPVTCRRAAQRTAGKDRSGIIGRR